MHTRWPCVMLIHLSGYEAVFLKHALNSFGNITSASTSGSIMISYQHQFRPVSPYACIGACVLMLAVHGSVMAHDLICAGLSLHSLYRREIRPRQGAAMVVCNQSIHNLQSKYGLGVAAVFMVFCSLSMSVRG